MFIQKRLDGSLILDVEISPNSETSRISGVNEWRKRLRIDISKPAVNGMANEELLLPIIQKFNIKSNQAELTCHKSKQKSIMVSGISDTDILSVVNQEVYEMSVANRELRFRRADVIQEALERVSDFGAILVVEGKKDTIALQEFGFPKGSIFEINRGWDLENLKSPVGKSRTQPVMVFQV